MEVGGPSILASPRCATCSRRCSRRARNRSGGGGVVRGRMGRRPVGRRGRRRGNAPMAGRQPRAAVLGDEAVRRRVRAAAGRPRSARSGRAGAGVLAGVPGARHGAAGPVASGRCRGARRSGRDRRLLRLGSHVLAARGPAAAVDSGRGARRVGAVLRPPGRRAGAPRRRTRPGHVPAGGGVRAAGPRVPRGTATGRAPARGGADRARARTSTAAPRRAGPSCTSARSPIPRGRGSRRVNGARWRAAEIPAINGHGTARGVAARRARRRGGRSRT